MTKEILPQSEPQNDLAVLEKRCGQIWEIARDFGMDPYPTSFELVPPPVMHELASYGLPDRFSHWTHGRVHHFMKTMYEYGLSRLYEMVINSEPSQAFLLETNEISSNTLVIAHVLGHTEFFKHNYMFAGTRKDMPRIAKLHAERVRMYEELYGEREVEDFLDAVLTLEENVDPSKPDRPDSQEQLRMWREEFEKTVSDSAPKLNEYDLLFGMKLDRPPKEGEKPRMKIPPEQDRDILGFLRDFSPVLTNWQRDIIDMIRSESLYFWPQRRTKIMNEGWASFWHKTILREMEKRGYLPEEEKWGWWKLHSGIVRPDPVHLQPYHFGMILFEYIMDYHNGNLSEDEVGWLKDNDLPVHKKYTGDFAKSPGLAKIREVMRTENDQSFIRNYFDRNTAVRLNMYIYDTREDDGKKYYFIVDRGWEEIRELLVKERDNAGEPYIVVNDADYQGKGELVLTHVYEGDELEVSYTEKTLPYLYKLWGKPVHLETLLMGDAVRFTYDGSRVTYSAV